MTRFGGTIFPTRFIVYTYWAMATVREWAAKDCDYRIGVRDDFWRKQRLGDALCKSRL